MQRWKGRVAVVTGASSGIGARIAEDLVRGGLVVVGVARRTDRLTSLATSLNDASGKFHVLQADLSKTAEVQRVFQWIEDNIGGLSILINNAAVLKTKPLQDLDAADMEAMVSTNLTAAMLCSKEAIANMKNHGIRDGHIININSTAGHSVINGAGDVSWSAYTATKYAITALSQGLRFDTQKIPDFKIRVTSVSPGSVDTDMIPPDSEDRAMGFLLLNTEDISNAVIYALSCPPNVEISEITIQPVGEPC